MQGEILQSKDKKVDARQMKFCVEIWRNEECRLTQFDMVKFYLWGMALRIVISKQAKHSYCRSLLSEDISILVETKSSRFTIQPNCSIITTSLLKSSNSKVDLKPRYSLKPKN